LKTLLSIVITGIIAVTILPHAFADVKASAQVTTEAQFQLKVNQTSSLESDGSKIKLLNVTADSRCPSDVTCVWQGEVKISVNIIKNNQDLGDFSLTSRAGQDLGINFDGHSIHVVKVEPYPSSGKKISTSEYMVTFAVKSNILSPLKQFKSGVSANDVKCKEGHVLVINFHKNFPACVRPQAASKLVLRGWHYPVNEQVLSKQGSSLTAANNLFFKLGPDTMGPVPHRLVFFMASDSNAKIYVQYTSNEPNTGTMNSWHTVYTGKANYTPLDSSQLTITADPASIPLYLGSNTTVVYTVTAQKDAAGIYWISLAQICGVMPVVINMESSHLGPSDIPVPSGPMYCPNQLLDAKILGIYGGIAQYKIAKPIP